MKKLSELSFPEFTLQKANYLAILKENSLKQNNISIFYYVIDSSIHVKTNSIILQMQTIKNVEYLICEGYKTTFIFCNNVLTVDNFMYFPLLSHPQLVSLHTCANLSLNHLSTNKLPMYISLTPENESKFVKTFLKLARTELHYNALKSRIIAITKHAQTCNKKNDK